MTAETSAAVADERSGGEVETRLPQWLERLPQLAAVAADAADEAIRRADEQGVDWQQRLARVAHLVTRLTDDANLRALDRLVGRLPQLAEAAEQLAQLPQLVAILGDTLDDWVRGAAEQGIDVETSLRQGLHAALWLGQRVSEAELERLGILLRSEVIDPQTLKVIGSAGASLKRCQSDVCEVKTSPRVGPLGLLRALFDPDVQRSLAFATQFARCFGHVATREAAPHQAAPEVSEPGARI